jgi:glycosyltransferase involved in cell wall biosynthesis
MQSGGGITLSNLFKGWDRTCLANAVTLHNINNIKETEYCNNFYYLGDNEFQVKYPFSIYLKAGQSGRVNFSDNKNRAQLPQNNLKAKILFFLKPAVNWVINVFNLEKVIYKINVSQQFLNWIDDFKPDYIYIQPSSRMGTNFFRQLHNVTGIPLVMHIMDDWQYSTNRGLLGSYWKKKIDKEFKELVNITSVHLSISEGMSKEYYKRYGKIFKTYHNTIEINSWLPFIKQNFEFNNCIRILYAGRIGLGTYHSFADLIEAVEELNSEGYNITINIQTPSVDQVFGEKLSQFKCVSFNPFVEYTELPRIFSSYDLLLLPIDFKNAGSDYLKFSMPTKVAEFMISGTPILLYSPREVYLHSHAVQHKWAYVIEDNNKQKIKKGILELIHNTELRKNISKTAVAFAKANYDSKLIRKNFKSEFI